MRVGYYPDFGTGIVIGILCGMFISAVLWGVITAQVQRLNARVRDQETLLVAAFGAAPDRRESP